MGQRVTKNMTSKTFFEQFLLNISGNMRDSEKNHLYFFVKNKIVRVLKKISSKSVQVFRSYVENSGQNGVPKHFFANIVIHEMVVRGAAEALPLILMLPRCFMQISRNFRVEKYL